MTQETYFFLKVIIILIKQTFTASFTSQKTIASILLSRWGNNCGRPYHQLMGKKYKKSIQDILWSMERVVSL